MSSLPDPESHEAMTVTLEPIAALITVYCRCTFTGKVLTTQNDTDVKLELVHLYVNALLFLHPMMYFILTIQMVKIINLKCLLTEYHYLYCGNKHREKNATRFFFNHKLGLLTKQKKQQQQKHPQPLTPT